MSLTVVDIGVGGTGLTALPTVNVKSFGAVGDGTTDDRVAIQAAIDSISAGTVVFNPGNYVVTTNGSAIGLTLKPNVNLMASGTSVYLLAGSNAISLLYYKNPSTTALTSNIAISGINLSSNSKTTCNGLVVDGNVSASRVSIVRVTDLQINGTFSTAISLTYCANTFISNVFISSSATGVLLTNCSDTNIMNTEVQSGSGIGFSIIGGAGAFDEGTRLTACSTNGQVYGLSLNGVDWGICTGCSFTTCSSGALATTGTNNNWKFVGCEFAVGGTPAQAGITLNSTCNGFMFSGCMFSNNTFGAIIGGTKHAFNGCYFTGNSNIDCYLNSSSKVVVSGNTMDSTGSSFSIFEITANYSNIIGNNVNGTITVVGANSVQTANINY